MKRLHFFLCLRILPFAPILSSAAVVSVCDEPSLRAAISGGGVVTFACDGVIALTNTLSVTQDLVLDAVGHSVVLNGGGDSGGRRVLRVSQGVNLTMTGITVTGGRDTNGFEGGGAMLNRGITRLINCTFSNNMTQGSGPTGGGAISSVGSLIVNGCLFVNNSAPNGYGGAIFLGPTLVRSGLTITNSTFYGNLAAAGGAIMSHCTPQVNAPAIVMNCTFLANGRNAIASPCHPITIKNSILSSVTNANFDSPPLDGGNNISSDSSALFTNLFSLNNIDPQLPALGSNGGPTLTAALNPGSPAIDSGDDNACTALDQRGVTRPFGLHCDSGAYEATLASTNPGVLQLGGATHVGSETATNLVFTVARMGSLEGTISVQFATSNETAMAGSDYQATNGTLVFGPTQRTNSIAVRLLNDMQVEDDETMAVHLSNPGAGVTIARSVQMGRILDNDVGFSFSAAEFQVRESNVVATITVSRRGSAGSAVSVQYATEAATALSGVDYQDSTGTLSFASGETNKTFAIAIRNDSLSESNEQVVVRLMNPGLNTTLLSPSIATLVIVDDELPPSVHFSNASFSSVETAREAVLAVSLATPTDRDLAVNFQTVAASATSGSDFVHTNGTITFLAGQTTKSMRIALVDDGPGEADESFTVTLSDPTTGLTVTTPATASVTIIDGQHTVDCDEAQLRTAVASGGRINLNCDGVIILLSPLVVSRAVLLDGVGLEPTLSGNGMVNHFRINPGVSLTLRDLTLMNGFVVGTIPPSVEGGPGEGGSIYNNGGIFRAIDCRFLQNIAQGSSGGDNTQNGGPGRGGAINNGDGGILLCTNCTFVNNTARGGRGGTGGLTFRGGDALGGAIFNGKGLAELHNCVLLTNASTSGEPAIRGIAGNAFGGAIANRGDLNMVAGVLQGNSSTTPTHSSPAYGGAIHCEIGAIALIDCSFLANLAQGGISGGTFAQPGGNAFGGAVSINGASAMIFGSLFNRNVARGGARSGAPGVPAGSGLGGALFNSGIVEGVNSTFSHNEAHAGGSSSGAAQGGAIYNGDGYARLTHLTIANNAVAHPSGFPGAILRGAGVFSTNVPITIQNSLLAHNAPGSNCVGLIIDGGKNLSTDDSCDFTFGGGLVNTDPLLGPLADYGGPTLTRALLQTSPAVDAANNLICPAADQRGVARPYGANCDIGAFESAPPYTILGRIDGYRQSQGGISVQAGDLSAPIADDGTYALHVLSPGTFTVRPIAHDAVFIPSNRIDVLGDTIGIDFYSYRSNAYVMEIVAADRVRAVFASAATATWRTLTSTNLIDWMEYRTQTTEANGLFEFIHTNTSPVLPQYFRGQRLP